MCAMSRKHVLLVKDVLRYVGYRNGIIYTTHRRDAAVVGSSNRVILEIPFFRFCRCFAFLLPCLSFLLPNLSLLSLSFLYVRRETGQMPLYQRDEVLGIFFLRSRCSYISQERLGGRSAGTLQRSLVCLCALKNKVSLPRVS